MCRSYTVLSRMCLTIVFLYFVLKVCWLSHYIMSLGMLSSEVGARTVKEISI